MLKIVVFFIFLFSSLVFCQNTFEISGEVSDIEDRIISVGDVLLFSPEKDSLINYTAILDGKFSLPSIPEGKYRLTISCLGFESQEKILAVTQNISLQLRLKEDATDLDEVEVIAAKPIVTNENGNLKFDIQNPVFSSIPEPMDVLARLPGIQVSPDKESLTILGKGTPLIYRGNQRMSLEEFNSLSVDDINSIEIIKNPSSKYEADGRSILLVTLKVSDTEGAKLNFSETLSFKQNFNNYNSINGSYKKRKLTLKGNFAYNDLQTWESHRFAFEIPKNDIASNYEVLIDKNDRVQINTGGGVFYQFNDTDYLSVNTNVKLQTDSFPIETETYLKQGVQEDFILTKTGNNNRKNFVSANLNYNKKVLSTGNLFTGLQYSSFVQKLNTTISNNYNSMGFVNSQDRQQQYQINVLAYRLDVEKSLENGFKWEIGTNVSTAKASALTNIQFLESIGMTNLEFDYSETNMAGYSQISGNLNENVNFDVGFRVENNKVQGAAQTDNIPLVNRENTNLIPKAMLNIEIDSTKSLTFNYGRSIIRPDYSRASSISAFINPFLEGSGNVNLLPTITEELTANLQVKNNSLSINYLQKRNPMYFTIDYEEGADNAVFSLRNLERESGLDISLTAPITKGIWTSTNFVMISTRWISDSSATVNLAKPYIYAYTDQQFKIAIDTTVSIGAWGFTKRSEGIFNRNALVSFNAALTKTFFKKLHLSFRWNDITRAMNFEEAYSINGVNANGVYFADGREIAFSLKYALGRIKDPSYKNKDVDENLDRIN